MKKISIRGIIVPSDDKQIYDYYGMEATCPKDIEAALQGAGGQSVTVEYNSKGGDVQSGVEMFTLLESYEGGVKHRILSFCFSAATLPACAGEDCEISPGGMYLPHNVRNAAYGDYRAMEKNSQLLQTANGAIANIYQHKTGKTLEELLALMDEDRVLSAQEAKDFGFVNGIMFQSSSPVQLVAEFDSGLLPQAVIEQTRQLLGDGRKAALLADINKLETMEDLT